MILVNLATDEVVQRSYADCESKDLKRLLREAKRDGFLPLDEAMKEESVNDHTLTMAQSYTSDMLFGLELWTDDKNHSTFYFPTVTDLVLCLRLGRPHLADYKWVMIEDYKNDRPILLDD